jgi:uncharacterized protein (TIGR03067 family)
MNWCLGTLVLVLLAFAAVALGKCRDWLAGGVGEDVLSAADREREKLNRHWVARLQGTEDSPGAMTPCVKLFLVGRRFTLKWPDGSFDQGTFTILLDRKPPAIDWTMASGAHAGKALCAIYRWAGGGFELCCGNVGQERPTEFVADVECGWRLYAFVRE